MDVLPAIDLLGGQVVRLHQGRYDAVTIYERDPAAQARAFRGLVPRLHVVDLEGARAGRAVQRDEVRALVAEFGPGVQVGGGVRSLEAIESYFELGAERVVMGTAAIRDPELLERAAQLYPGRIVVALDAKDGRVATEGWEQLSERTAAAVAKEIERLPIAAILYTDIARDGTGHGPNVPATLAMARATALPILASGGVSSLADLRELARLEVVAGAIVGRALYERVFTLEEAVAAARVDQH
jgi:phosphoribosylformimino-5-aminoimidazole carboxamide ribotide isomerase